MKKIVKLSLILGLIIGTSLPMFPVSAVENSGCSTITYYSKKEWVSHYNLIDGTWDSGMNNFMTSSDVLVHANTFGVFSYPWMASSDTFYGHNPIEVASSRNERDPNYFSIQFGKEIKIEEIEYELSAYNAITMKPIEYKVYLNAGMKWVDGYATITGGELILSSDAKERTKLNLEGKTVSSILIGFDEYTEDNRYLFNYFQVNSYKMYEHTEWTRDYIEDTETKDAIICNGRGNYTPDGNGNWEKKSSTIFSPSVNIVSNYVPIVSSQNVSYDFCRGNYIGAYSQPNCIIGMDTPSRSIRGWIESGSRPWSKWYSYGTGGSAFPYISTSVSTGVQYDVTPVYWNQNREGTWINGVISYDSGWCNHTTGSSRTPCYKHTGHSGNSRLNSYDVTVKAYRNVVDPSFRAISKTEYYLVNEDTRKETYLFDAKEEVQSFDFVETGRWRIKAVVTDFAGLQGSKSSNIFYIDNLAPYVKFEPSEDTRVENEGIEVVFNVEDNHSGIKQWRYAISKDGGVTWGNYSNFMSLQSYKLSLLDSGDYQIKVHALDKAGNESVTLSPIYSISRGRASLGKMYTTVYEMGKENLLHLKIEHSDLSPSATATLKILLDDVEIANKNLYLTNSDEVIIPYTSNQPMSKIKAILLSESGVQIDNSALELNINAKSFEHKETEEKELHFEASTVFMIEQSLDQQRYNEELTLYLRQDKDVYFAGEGIDMKVEANYYNACGVIENWECNGSSKLSFGTASAIFEDGAEVVSDIFKKDGAYEIPIEYDEPFILLPDFVVSKYEGKIYLSENDVPRDDEAIDAGRKWYTNKEAEEKVYKYDVRSIDLAVNQFSWLFKSKYEIHGDISDQFRMRFVDTMNPFPNINSYFWRESKSWFVELE